MQMRSVRVYRRQLTMVVGVLSLSTAVLLSSEAEAGRRKHRSGGGYAPPYAAMVVDAKTGRVLHAQNEDAPRHPASVTKVMTLYLVFEQLERGRLALDTPLQVSANASRQAPSKLGLAPGSTIEVEDAIKALVTKSANDVAVIVAENLGGSEEAFAEQMTRKARALGMNNTVYRNASGLPNPEQTTTARDLTILGRAIQDRFPRQYRYFQTRVFNYAGASYRNHNKLLGRVEGVDGIKTGFTRASGFNLLTSARTEDRHVIAAVLGGRSGASRDQIMAGLVRTSLPRAYAGARTLPAVADASERARPAVVAEFSRGARTDVETTAGTTTSARSREPLDLNTMRPVAVATTTPSAFSWGASSRPVPQAAAAYTAQPSEPTRAPALSASPAAPAPKIEARLPAPEAIALARSEASEPPPPARPAAARPSPVPSGWVIQLGALDDEQKAKDILNQARSASGRALAKASPFTERVQRDGTTLYRARFSGFEEADMAQEACKAVKRSGFSCFATRS